MGSGILWVQRSALHCAFQEVRVEILQMMCGLVVFFNGIMFLLWLQQGLKEKRKGSLAMSLISLGAAIMAGLFTAVSLSATVFAGPMFFGIFVVSMLNVVALDPS